MLDFKCRPPTAQPPFHGKRPTFPLICHSLVLPSCPDTLPSLCSNYTLRGSKPHYLTIGAISYPPWLSPLMCAPFYSTLFSRRERRENHFSRQQHREGKWIRKQRQKGIKTQPIEQVPSLCRGLRLIWQLSTACRCLQPLAETGKSCSCSITLDTGSLNREIGTSRRAARDTQICNKEPDSDHCSHFVRKKKSKNYLHPHWCICLANSSCCQKSLHVWVYWFSFL